MISGLAWWCFGLWVLWLFRLGFRVRLWVTFPGVVAVQFTSVGFIGLGVLLVAGFGGFLAGLGFVNWFWFCFVFGVM